MKVKNYQSFVNEDINTDQLKNNVTYYNKYKSRVLSLLKKEDITKLENDPLGTHMINGELRIKDITRPVSFKAVVDLASGVALKATAEPFVIDRTEWNIKFKSKKFFEC